jgi:energy-coupling factor transporter ATP-binding protein EcfA2
MPIQILDFAEPLSAGRIGASNEPVLIKSAAYDQLLHELRRYCNLQASGRSFLVAGHRGSGKTTLVLSVFEKILRESQTRNVKLRPLMVQLLGPSLLPDPEEKELAAPGEGAASGESKLTGFENVLVQITLALHRAVVRELTQAYRERMSSLAFPIWRGRKQLDTHRVNAFLEAPGQLALELDEYPGKARLREFWRRAGALPHGLLPRPSGGPPGSVGEERFVDQGIRELVALCSVSEAYRRISGTIQAKKKDEAGAQSSQTKTRELELRGKEFVTPLITLLTGGAVASGVAAFNPDHIGIAVLAGVLTALGSALVSKYSSSRSQQRSASQEDLFIPNLSVATLDRVLPVLLERIRDAGLAPVFVIDELDKVKDLSKRIPQMVKRLKKLVAESTFFCFLADRFYFEEMRCRNIMTPYSMEYTYFTNKLFVTFWHLELHKYLVLILQKPPPLTASATASAEERQAVTDRNEEIDDHAVLPYVVLHAAQMHPIDLRREVSAIRSPDNVVALPLGSVRSLPSRRLELLMQVAIELLLEDQKMEWEIGRDPAFRRLAHDALYFISRSWESDTENLRFDAKGQASFTQYLIDRMKTELPEAEPRGGTVSAEADNEIGPADSAVAPKITPPADKIAPTQETANDSKNARDKLEREELLQPSPLQTKFLWGFVRRLANLLAEPGRVRTLAIERQQELARKNPRDPPRFAAQVLDALKFTDPGPLLELAAGATDVFNWRYNRSGRVLVSEPAAGKRKKPPPTEAVALKPLASREAELIEAFNEALLHLTGKTINCGNLGTTFGVISPSPAWPSVQPALERLKSMGGEYPQEQDDMSIVGEFAKLLRRGAEPIALSICCGLVIGAWRANKKERRIFVGLQTFSAALRLKELHEEAVTKRIREFGTEVVRAIDPSPLPAFSLTDAASVRTWRGAVVSLLAKARRSALLEQPIDNRVQGKAWEYWRRRLRETDAVPNLEAVICAAARKGPSEVLSFPPEEMTARAWSEAFCASVIAAPALASAAEEGPAAAATFPPWLAFVALQRLGFGARMPMLPASARLLFNDLVDVTALPEVGHWSIFAPAKEAGPSAIIVSKAGAESEKWHPAREWPVLVLREPELLQLQRLWRDNRKFVLRWLGQRWLVFDWSVWHPIEQSSADQTDELPVVTTEELDRATDLVRFFSGDISATANPAIVPREWRGKLPPPFLPVAAPDSLDQLFAVISREAPRDAPDGAIE